MASGETGRVIVQHGGARVEIPQGKELVHADQLEVMLESMLESIEGRYATKQEVVNAVNAIMRIHLTKYHTPWYRRFLAWALEPIFARRALEQQDPTRKPVPDALEVTRAPEPEPDRPADEGRTENAAVRRRHVAEADGETECWCGDFHFPEDLTDLDDDADGHHVTGVFHEEAPPMPETEVLANGVKFRNRRKVRD